MKRLFCVIGMIYVVLFFAGFVDAQQSTVDHAIIVTDSDPQSLKIARVVAEQYWNAQKISDEKSFQEVTSQSLMKVVFDWSFVKQSDIRIEQGPISKIKDDLSACIDIETKVDALPKSAYSQKATLLKKVAEHARKIESQGHTMLGDALKRGYWSTIIPIGHSEIFENGQHMIVKLPLVIPLCGFLACGRDHGLDPAFRVFAEGWKGSSL